MTWQKGESGNPGGLTRNQARVRRMIDGLSITATERLGQLLKSDNESVALAAAKEVLGRVAPMPKAVNISGQIEHGPNAHLAALVGLAVQTATRSNSGMVLDAQCIDIPTLSTNALHSSHADAEEIPLAIDTQERNTE